MRAGFTSNVQREAYSTDSNMPGRTHEAKDWSGSIRLTISNRSWGRVLA